MEKTKNIISNNCVGARYYENMGACFENPFMWVSIKLKDFIYLIENFDTIDFFNVNSYLTMGEFYKDDVSFLNCDSRCCTSLIDNNIKIYYIHHHYTKYHKTKKVFRNKISEENFKKGITNNVEYDMVGCDILQYLDDKWFERLKRMKKSNKKPIFVYWDSPSYTNDDITKLFSLKTKYTIIVLSEKDYSKLENENCRYLQLTCKNTKKMAEQLTSYIKNNL